MNRPNLPLSGGVYIEHIDGRLERIEDAPAAAPTRPTRRVPSRDAPEAIAAAEPTTTAEPAPTE